MDIHFTTEQHKFWNKFY